MQHVKTFDKMTDGARDDILKQLDDETLIKHALQNYYKVLRKEMSRLV